MAAETSVPKLEARVHLHQDAGAHAVKLLAFAELTIGDAFVIKGIRILQGDDAPFVVFPAEKGKGMGRWYDIAHPCTAEARGAAVETILTAYAKLQEAP